jgi:hypothetical protein
MISARTSIFLMYVIMTCACVDGGTPVSIQESPCEAEARSCAASVERGQTKCERHYEQHYRAYCINNYARNKRPRDRYGRPWETSSTTCRWYVENGLQLLENALDKEERKQIFQQVQRCRARVSEECMTHHANSEPGEGTGHIGPLELHADQFFGDLAAEIAPISWGGDRGFQEACTMAAHEMSQGCQRALQECLAW